MQWLTPDSHRLDLTFQVGTSPVSPTVECYPSDRCGSAIPAIPKYHTGQERVEPKMVQVPNDGNHRHHRVWLSIKLDPTNGSGRFLCSGISSPSCSAARCSYSTKASDRLVVRWIHRVSIGTMRLRSDLPRGRDSSFFASQSISKSWVNAHASAQLRAISWKRFTASCHPHRSFLATLLRGG